MRSLAEMVDGLTLPVIAAPMTGVSGPELVTAACRSGIVGSFPTHNAPTVEALGGWLDAMHRALADAETAGPIAPNLVVHASNPRLEADLACLLDHGTEVVITSVGSPAEVTPRLHAGGCAVLADVATMRHVDRAIDAGVDGLVLLTAGAGGQTGTANPFAFVRAVRERFDGTIVLAGGITDGASILAAQVLGADLVYLGTRIIATTESMADEGYRTALLDASMDDVRLSSVVGGIPASLLTSWLTQRGVDDDAEPVAKGFRQERLLSNQDVWSAGHGVAAVKGVEPLAAVLTTLHEQYDAARRALRAS